MSAPVELVLDRLREHGSKVRPENGAHKAQCPAHADRTPSLSIKEGNDGRALLHCHAGCDLAAVLGALGLSDADLFVTTATPTVPPPLATMRDERVAEYVYRDAAGEPVVKVARVHTVDLAGNRVGKAFRQSRWEGNRWVSGLNGAVPPLYRLPEVLAAVAAGSPVVVVEGEKDADRAAAIGYTATTNPMGSGKWRDVHTAALAGATVTIIADDDEPGRAHAVTVAEALSAAGCAVAAYVPAAGCKDLSEHLDAGHRIDALRPMASTSPPQATQAQDPALVGTTAPTAPTPLYRAVSRPAFPVDVFPGWMADMVSAVARFTQTDPAMPGAVALSVLAACAGGRLEVEARPGWREPTNLFVAVVARPGERKSPVQTVLTAPLRKAEQYLVDTARPAIQEAEVLLDIARQEAQRARSEAARAESEAGRKTKAADAVAAAMVAEAIVVPKLPRLLADDVTPEALASLMADNHGKIAVISDEGGVFDMLAGRYSSLPNLDAFLKGHAGTPMRVDRKGRDAEYIEQPALTVALMVQPTVLHRLGANATFTGRGLLARFLFVLPTSYVGHRDVNAAPVADEVAAAYAEQVGKLAVTLAGWTDPAVVTLTADAAAVLVELAGDIEGRLAAGGDLDHVADWANKLVGATIRIAGLLHVAHHPDDAWRQQIDADMMRAAVRLAEFFTAHYLAATEAMGADPVVEGARYLLTLAGHLDRFTVRDLFAKVTRSRFPKIGDMLPALDLLEEHGWITREEETTKTGPGRKPSPTYTVHHATESAQSAESEPPSNSADTADSAA